MKNKILITLLLVLIPSIGWGMECVVISKYKTGMFGADTEMEKCIDKDAICYKWHQGYGSAISCIKNEVNNGN
jgi:hypothetical protein